MDIKIETVIPQSAGKRRFQLESFLAAAAAFVFGQGILQVVNICSGLFLVRELSVVQYAQFGLALGFQTTAALLMDLGYASTIIPLVGNRIEDRTLVGSYLRAAKHLRDRAFWVFGPIAVIAFLAAIHKRGWEWTTQVGLLVSILLSLYSSGPVSYYSAPLLLFSKLWEFYIPQSLTGLGRLLAYAILKMVGGLNAVAAAAILACNVLINAVFLKRAAHRYVTWPEANEPERNREVVNFILPALPTFLFAAFQSQIALFLVNAFGSTANVAEVAALTRLSQLFSVLSSLNFIIIEPRVAKLSSNHLLRTYLLLASLPIILCVLAVPVAFAFPAPFLWLIGPKYESVRGIIGWVILTACLNYAANLIWVMNRARKWIFWRGTIIEIAAMLSVNVIFVTFIGVHNTRQAIFFTLASSVSAVCTHAYIGLYGFQNLKHGTS